MDFAAEFSEFISSQGLSYIKEGLLFSFPEKEMKIRLVPLDNFHLPERKSGTIYLFEDRWRAAGPYIKDRLLAHLGIFRSIFARNCKIERIDAATAAGFLNRHHSYGTAKAQYKYGMYLNDELVAVSLFSSARNMPREIDGRRISLRSYEWVRFASISGCRISGGMSRMLARFIRDVRPDEVMSYADLEWSEGTAYARMGFRKAGIMAPVTFWVNPDTYARERTAGGQGVEIHNFGSIKYLKLINFTTDKQ